MPATACSRARREHHRQRSNDANTPAGVAFQQGWVDHLIGRWGTAGNGGLRIYLLDNEHSLWQSTHREVKQTGATMDEIRQKMIDYGAMVKTADPVRHRRRPGGVGLERLLLVRLRPAVRRRQRLVLLPRPRRARRHGLHALAADQLRAVRQSDRQARARRVLAALVPAGRRVRQRHLHGDAAAAQSLDPLALGSELHRRDLDQRQGAADSAA
jgi:hypothetical protein